MFLSDVQREAPGGAGDAGPPPAGPMAPSSRTREAESPSPP